MNYDIKKRVLSGIFDSRRDVKQRSYQRCPLYETTITKTLTSLPSIVSISNCSNTIHKPPQSPEAQSSADDNRECAEP